MDSYRIIRLLVGDYQNIKAREAKRCNSLSSSMPWLAEEELRKENGLGSTADLKKELETSPNLADMIKYDPEKRIEAANIHKVYCADCDASYEKSKKEYSKHLSKKDLNWYDNQMELLKTRDLEENDANFDPFDPKKLEEAVRWQRVEVHLGFCSDCNDKYGQMLNEERKESNYRGKQNEKFRK